MSLNAASLDGDHIIVGNKPYPVLRYSTATVLAAGDLVAAAAGKKHRVIWVSAFVDAGGNIVMRDGTTVKLTFGATVAGAQVVLPVNPFGWTETTAGAALTAVVTGGTNTLDFGYITI